MYIKHILWVKKPSMPQSMPWSCLSEKKRQSVMFAVLHKGMRDLPYLSHACLRTRDRM